MQTVLFGFFRAVNVFIHRPWTVLWTCAALAFGSVVLDGTLFRLWSLHRELNSLESSTQQLQFDVVRLDGLLKQAKDPAFLERQARDRFDLVSEGDLVFVFADEEKN